MSFQARIASLSAAERVEVVTQALEIVSSETRLVYPRFRHLRHLAAQLACRIERGEHGCISGVVL
jgi:hypothetical protein